MAQVHWDIWYRAQIEGILKHLELSGFTMSEEIANPPAQKETPDLQSNYKALQIWFWVMSHAYRITHLHGLFNMF